MGYIDKDSQYVVLKTPPVLQNDSLFLLKAHTGGILHLWVQGIGSPFKDPIIVASICKEPINNKSLESITQQFEPFAAKGPTVPYSGTIW